ncbi:hypothetical protein DAPPUDRAFT_325144 [Daphnia pulex]|uniref:Uncharacterized protein n=1 Tax=Daphnia pulex TaxID=6669 RepID=E9H3V0_DAPPU|nr:hypothetical protein DAPPUDRAFT_325144 [Daphnia pulex]|eukprot:EFX73590.1 hypothetical protein DAPPUDRAFT_325144 [Daphnia pulex]
MDASILNVGGDFPICSVESTRCLCYAVPTMLRDENLLKTESEMVTIYLKDTFLNGFLGRSGIGAVNGGDVWCAVVRQSISDLKDALKLRFLSSICHVGVNAVVSCCVKNNWCSLIAVWQLVGVLLLPVPM